MSKKFILSLISLLSVFALLFYYPHYTNADELEEINKKIDEYEREIQRTKVEANTLSNQIAQYDAQINLTSLKIEQTEEKIGLLGNRIDELELSLDSLTNAFTQRVAKSYKMTRLGKPFFLLLSASDMSQAVSSYYYLEKIQEADRGLLIKLEDAKETYRGEKVKQEDLQLELEDQQQVLGVQKSSKAKLLEITKNDERKYQSLLAQAKAERDAIQAIIAGKGEEEEVKDVGIGERIASIIPGASPCSSGGHLHFEVAEKGVNKDPSRFLKQISINWDNAPDSPFSFSGNWEWPLNEPIRITQGYGMTYFASNLGYYGGAPHTGIDMVNNDNYTVKSAQTGKLFRGSIKCGGGYLRYVHVKQNDGLDSYYLHVNY